MCFQEEGVTWHKHSVPKVTFYSRIFLFIWYPWRANSNKFTVKYIVLTIPYNMLYEMCNFTYAFLEASEKEKQPEVYAGNMLIKRCD